MPTAVEPVDAIAIAAAVRSRIALDEAPAAFAARVVAGLTPERWGLEWYLPTWLVDRFELGAEVGRRLTESNVLGLVAVRLEDDLNDGEVTPVDAGLARQLAARALDQALEAYRDLFPRPSPFWPWLESTMATWRAAPGRDLAARAAPTKVPAFACCVLAGQLETWRKLEQCLDRAATALVLYDDFVDWEADLRAGRWNAFAALALGDQGSAMSAERRVTAVKAAMLGRQIVTRHFAATLGAAADAERRATDLEMPELAAWLRTWRRRTRAQGRDVANHYGRVADVATRALFGVLPRRRKEAKHGAKRDVRGRLAGAGARAVRLHGAGAGVQAHGVARDG